MDASGWIVFVLICGLIGGLIASNKSKQTSGFFVGFLLGVFLGPVGIILTLFLKPSKSVVAKEEKQARADQRECPHCKEWMRREASVCPHCQRESPAWRKTAEGFWFVTSEGTDYWLDEKQNAWVRYG